LRTQPARSLPASTLKNASCEVSTVDSCGACHFSFSADDLRRSQWRDCNTFRRRGIARNGAGIEFVFLRTSKRRRAECLCRSTPAQLFQRASELHLERERSHPQFFLIEYRCVLSRIGEQFAEFRHL